MTLHTVTATSVVKSLELPEQTSSMVATDGGAVRRDALNLVSDVKVTLDIYLGGATMTIKELMTLNNGSVVELDRLIGEPIDVHLNDRMIARAEIVAVGEHFGIRMTEILAESQ